MVEEFSKRVVRGGLQGEKSVISVTFRASCPLRHISRGSIVTTRCPLKRIVSFTYVCTNLLFYCAVRHQTSLWLAPGGLKGRDYTPPLPLLYLWDEGVS